MRHHIELDLTIEFQSKWRTGSGAGSMLVDRLVARDACSRPFIPGSLLKGVVRETCEKLCRTMNFPAPSDPHEQDLDKQDLFLPLSEQPSPVDRLFGNAYEAGGLFFRNATLEDKTPYGSLFDRNRIRRYRVIGTAREHHLFGSEYAAPLKFKTTVSGWHDNLVSLVEEDPPYAYCLLIAALLQVDRIGGDKSTGSGAVRIKIDSGEYNRKSISLDTVFEYLEADLYEEAK